MATAKGRPAGAENRSFDHAEGQVTRCGQCGSTDRAPYYGRREVAFDGLDPQGRPYTHVVLRRTKCLACHQHRIDRHYENRRKPARKK